MMIRVKREQGFTPQLPFAWPLAYPCCLLQTATFQQVKHSCTWIRISNNYTVKTLQEMLSWSHLYYLYKVTHKIRSKLWLAVHSNMKFPVSEGRRNLYKITLKCFASNTLFQSCRKQGITWTDCTTKANIHKTSFQRWPLLLKILSKAVPHCGFHFFHQSSLSFLFPKKLQKKISKYL